MFHFHKWKEKRYIRNEVWFGEEYEVWEYSCVKCNEVKIVYIKANKIRFINH